MEDRQRLEEIINELNAYKAQAEMLNQQVETLKATIADMEIAQETLDSIKGKKSPETLVPIGAGSFLITEIKNTEEVIVGLGSGAAVKKNIDDAKESIEEQKKKSWITSCRRWYLILPRSARSSLRKALKLRHSSRKLRAHRVIQLIKFITLSLFLFLYIVPDLNGRI